MDSTGLCSLVKRSLPLREESDLSDCIGEIQAAFDWYARLKAAATKQMSSKLRRKMINEGRGILAKLQSWIVRSETTITRDYVLSAMRSEPDQRRRADALVRVWREQLTNVHQWQTRLDQALVLFRATVASPRIFRSSS